jgi:hypothetical protein
MKIKTPEEQLVSALKKRFNRTGMRDISTEARKLYYEKFYPHTHWRVLVWKVARGENIFKEKELVQEAPRDIRSLAAGEKPEGEEVKE